MRKQKLMKPDKKDAAILLCGLVLLVLIAGCSSPSPQNRTAPVTAPSYSGSCTDTTCFIAAANDCGSMELTNREDIGTVRYSSSGNGKCVFTKTILSLNSAEIPTMKTMLEGKNMSCRYTKGKFDSRLVTTLTGGMEYCEGELKENLGRLMVFT